MDSDPKHYQQAIPAPDDDYNNDNSVVITIHLSVPPAETTVSLVMQRPTEIELRLTPPTNDGGQPVKKYLLKYKVEVSSEDPLVKEINRCRFCVFL